MTNVVFIPAINSRHLNDVDSYINISKSTWKHYCDKVGAQLVIMEEPLRNPDDMKVTWQRWKVHELLTNSGIKYEKVLMVDADTMIHWDAPNIFDIDGFSACVDNDNIGWVKDSIIGYKKMFGSELDL